MGRDRRRDRETRTDRDGDGGGGGGLVRMCPQLRARNPTGRGHCLPDSCRSEDFSKTKGPPLIPPGQVISAQGHLEKPGNPKAQQFSPKPQPQGFKTLLSSPQSGQSLQFGSWVSVSVHVFWSCPVVTCQTQSLGKATSPQPCEPQFIQGNSLSLSGQNTS